jgi:hypothetical protein
MMAHMGEVYKPIAPNPTAVIAGPFLPSFLVGSWVTIIFRISVRVRFQPVETKSI